MIANIKSTAGHDPDQNNGTASSKSSVRDTTAATADKTSETKPVPDSEFKKQMSGAQLPTQTQEFMKSRLIAANFGNIVTVLMQSSIHKDRKISDLRDIVVPALLNNQFRISEAHKKGSGYTIPVGVILWARVSDDMDKRLSTLNDEDIQLTTEDWVSGDNIWIIELVGEKRFLTSLFKDLRQKEFKDKKVKYRRKTEKGFEATIIP